MKYTYAISIIFSIITLNGCGVNKPIHRKEVIGKHKRKCIYGVGEEFTFKEDGTFKYSWVTGLMSGTTIGTWYIKKENSIILNSEKQPESVNSFYIKRSSVLDSNYYKIKIVDLDGESMPFCSCEMKNKSTIIEQDEADWNGICLLSFNKDADSIELKYIGYKTAIVDIKVLKENSITVELVEDKYYEFFTNKILKIKNGRIYDPKFRKNKYNEKYFNKIE